MDVLRLAATQFIRSMSTGRTHPLLLGCEDASGEFFEVVVKFRGRELTKEMQIAELVAAQLADDLGLQVPQASLVDVPVGFEAIISQAEPAAMVKVSSGLNFGSLHLGPGFTTWPPRRSPHGAQRDQAAEIFAFDTLVQNPDRRADTPNLWVRSDRIGVLDHEQAFSFLALPIMGGSPKPWRPVTHGDAFKFLENHIFRNKLGGGRLNLGPFKERLGALTNRQIQDYVEVAPAEWRNQSDFCGRIADYLREARREREDLINFVKHLLK